MHNREALITPALEPRSRSVRALSEKLIIGPINGSSPTALCGPRGHRHSLRQRTFRPTLCPFPLCANTLNTQPPTDKPSRISRYSGRGTDESFSSWRDWETPHPAHAFFRRPRDAALTATVTRFCNERSDLPYARSPCVPTR